MRNIQVEVVPSLDSDESLADLKLFHAGCFAQMRIFRDVGSDQYSLGCSCGVEFRVPQFGSAVTAIKIVAIGEESQTLMPSSYSSSSGIASISLRPRTPPSA